MADLIDRQTLMDGYRHMGYDSTEHPEESYMEGWCKGFNSGVEHCTHHLIHAPSVDAEPVRHGHWVYGEDEDGVDGYRCNKCGFFVTWDYQHSHIHFIDDYLFCPHCNARMDEVK